MNESVENISIEFLENYRDIFKEQELPYLDLYQIYPLLKNSKKPRFDFLKVDNSQKILSYLYNNPEYSVFEKIFEEIVLIGGYNLFYVSL